MFAVENILVNPVASENVFRCPHTSLYIPHHGNPQHINIHNFTQFVVFEIII